MRRSHPCMAEIVKMDRKRKTKVAEEEEKKNVDRQNDTTTNNEEFDPLALTLALPTSAPNVASPPPPPPQPPHLFFRQPSFQAPKVARLASPNPLVGHSSSSCSFQPPVPAEFPPPLHPRLRRPNTALTYPQGKSEFIPPPFPWSSQLRACVLPIDHILSKGIVSIPGEVQCKRCDFRAFMEFGLKERFVEVAEFIVSKKEGMNERAPAEWMNPPFPRCNSCLLENSMRPVVAQKKRNINWLFMLLGQSIGVCTLDQLKYFCKHNKKHRTGAKDRVLYYTFMEVCKQLDPNGPFR